MSRPLRIEFPGAVYHVTSRGDRREPIYRDDEDREAHLAVIARAMERFDAQALAYCLMGNHYHLVLQTRQANLSRLMRQVNGVYTQAFNRRHGVAGHLFQGRFKAILVDRDAYLLALCLYVERNPVAAGLVATAKDWRWSSCRAHTGHDGVPPWLDSDGLYGQLLGRPVKSKGDRTKAAQQYAALVEDDAADGSTFWQEALRGQIFLGDEDFVARMQAQAAGSSRGAVDIPKAQRRGPFDLQRHLAESADRDGAMLSAYRDHGMTMTAIAAEAGLSVSRVSRVIKALEAKGKT
ncbi:MAG TPA: transposase [Burkholderiaceae bacterium]|uniref:transposase n=1 Tax=Accumulibacter sp. TaxID=2053492 RepID=UPI002CB3F38A|nr:transposase [Accumulibacter sp.]HMW57736.1 transposase [Accumulibacter sp.]HMX10027.1 transposase [Burkholderiaceae bacterium]HNB44134.1 transposase [Burkholderiaceae bacterium]HNG81162.1 transposase [Burkholderiaceae bacterium]